MNITDNIQLNLKDNKNQRILIIYNSKFGSTGEIASYMGKKLTTSGFYVEIKTIREIVDLNAYDNIIVGSAIQYDNWMRETRKFVKTNQDALSRVPVAYFFTCLVLSEKSEKAKDQAKSYAEKLYNITKKFKPVSVQGFAGVLNYSKMNLLFKIVAKVIFAFIGVKEGDYREWEKIGSWVEGLDFKKPLEVRTDNKLQF